MIKGIIGIEFSNRKALICQVGRNGLETINSETGDFEIPICAGFKEDERTFAEHSLQN